MSPHSAPDLPRSVADFIAARNRRDYDAAIAAIAPNATVSDEGGMGSFPGSPAVLRFAFILGAEGIDRLEIGA